jgi:hypothetical protein
VAPEQLFRPFQIVTGDAAIDAVLSGRDFKVTGPDGGTGDATVNVPSGSQQEPPPPDEKAVKKKPVKKLKPAEA